MNRFHLAFCIIGVSIIQTLGWAMGPETDRPHARTAENKARKRKELGNISLVTAGDVELSRAEVTLLDVRSQAQFRDGHIAGSQWIDLGDYTAEAFNWFHRIFGNPSLWGRIAEPSPALNRRLRELGISNEKPIVVIGTPRAGGEEGRWAWNLLYWGAEEVWLLDGGISAWIASGRRTEKGDAPAARPGNFRFQLRPVRRIEKAALQAALGKTTIVDSRPEAAFSGEGSRGEKRTGHLPGARSIPYTFLYETNGHFVAAGELRRRLPLGEKDSAAVYSTDGVSSALLAVIYEARVGNVLSNYDAGLWEWSSDSALPLE